MPIRYSTAVLVVLLLLSSTAIGSLHGEKMIQSETGIIMGTTDSVESCLDPASAYDLFGWQIIQNLGCGLVEHKVNASGSPDQYAQSLATSWNVSEDGLAWTFNLRQGVKYDDGTEFNATHVKYTFDRGIGIADPSGAWLGIGYGDIIRNVTVINNYTIRFDLNIPFAPFLSLLAIPVAFIVDPAYAPIDQIVTYSEGNPRASNPMGLGPYVLKNWTRVAGRDVEMELEANPNYWNAGVGIPKTKNIIIQFYQSSTSLRLAIQAGEIDLAYRQLAVSDIVALKENAAFKVWEGSGAFIQYLVLQEKYWPFNVTEIRLALAAAINRTMLVSTVFQGQAQNLYSIIPVGMFVHKDVFQNLGDPNYTRTQELLASYGFNATNKFTFTLWYETSGHYPQSQQQAQVLKASMEASGVITVNLTGLDWASMSYARRTGTMDAFIYGWYPDYIDPDDYTYPLVHSVGSSWLNCNYSNPSVDELIEAGRENFTEEERTVFYSQIQSLVAEDCPIIPLYQGLTQAVSVQDIEDIYLDVSQLLRLWYLARKTRIGTVYIKADGSVDPPTAPISTVDNITYTLDGHLYSNIDADGIDVERDNIVIDGSGFTIQGMRTAETASPRGILVFGSNVTIRNVNIENFIDGIFLESSSNSCIIGNKITSTYYNSILLESSSGNSINGNKVINNVGDGVRLISKSENNNIGENTIINNYYGIAVASFSDSLNNTISGNDIANNGYGIIFYDASNNIVYHNNFINNTVQVDNQTLGYSTFWDNGCEGNYWSNYNGTDLSNDGVGDTYLPWEAVDNYPLMNVYWNPCDINHDLKVDFKDIGRSARAFGTSPKDTWWTPHADITGPDGVPDGKVDMRDINLTAKHFGERYF